MSTRLARNAERLCRARGARLTRQRRSVLEIVAASKRPLGAYEILDALRREQPGAAPATVYRALDFLLEQGLVHRLESLHSYIRCVHPGEPHPGQFLICRDCGLVEEIEYPAIQRSIGRAAEHSGFQASDEVIEIRGRCRGCAR